MQAGTADLTAQHCSPLPSLPKSSPRAALMPTFLKNSICSRQSAGIFKARTTTHVTEARRVCRWRPGWRHPLHLPPPSPLLPASPPPNAHLLCRLPVVISYRQGVRQRGERPGPTPRHEHTTRSACPTHPSGHPWPTCCGCQAQPPCGRPAWAPRRQLDERAWCVWRAGDHKCIGR